MDLTFSSRHSVLSRAPPISWQRSRRSHHSDGGAHSTRKAGPLESLRAVVAPLFSPSLRSTTLVLWSVFFANAFTYYGLVLLTSQVRTAADVHSRRLECYPAEAGADVIEMGATDRRVKTRACFDSNGCLLNPRSVCTMRDLVHLCSKRGGSLPPSLCSKWRHKQRKHALCGCFRHQLPVRCLSRSQAFSIKRSFVSQGSNR